MSRPRPGDDSALPPLARRLGRIVAWTLGGVLVLALAASAWIGVRGYLAYGHLRHAQAAASSAKADLSDPAKVSGTVAKLSADTSAAHALTSDPVWRAAEGLPWVGPQLHAVATVSAALDEVASTALAPLAKVASSFSLESLRPHGGAVDLAAFTKIRSAAVTAGTGLGDAAASVDAIDRTPLAAPLRRSIDQVAGVLTEADRATAALTNAAALLPPMLGADGPRDYLLMFQNNAELRSLGGIGGSMLLVHTENGKMTLVAHESSRGFPYSPEPVLPLDPEVTGIFGTRPGQWIQNVTQVPDFTIAAPLAREMWARQHGGQKVDGVISLDPVALSYLLTATGPVTLPTGDVLTSQNAVSLLLNEVYKRYADPKEHDVFFAAAASAVFGALTAGDVKPAALVAALTRAGDEHRLLIWSAHPDDQKVLADTTLAGHLPVTDATASRFGVYLNDGTGSKMDYYLRDDIAVDWGQCQRTGSTASGTATLTVTLRSDAPADAASLPWYITGGGAFGVPVGTMRTIGYLYLPPGFALADAKLSTGGGFGGGFHEGRQVLSFTVDLTPGQSATATVTVRVPDGSAPTVAVDATPTVVSRDGAPLASTCEIP